MDDLTRLRNAAREFVLEANKRAVGTDEYEKKKRALLHVLHALEQRDKKTEEANKYNYLTGMRCILVEDEKKEHPTQWLILGNNKAIPGLLELAQVQRNNDLGGTWSSSRAGVLVLGEDIDIKTVAVRREK